MTQRLEVGVHQVEGMSLRVTQAIFLAAAAACVLPWVSPPIALALGLAFALCGGSAFPTQSKKISRLLIQVCIVLLGLRIDLGELVHEAQSGLLFAAGTIFSAFMLGWLLGKLLKTGNELTLLVSSGTAICGGSAIAAMGSAIGASASAVAVATGAIFILNAVALYVFIPIGHACNLSAAEFGTWAGVAIHDMSAVSGAGKAYVDSQGVSALDTATIVKLSRVVWIVPCTLFGAWLISRELAVSTSPQQHNDSTAESNPLAVTPAKPSLALPPSKLSLVARIRSIFPTFILWFILASTLRTFVADIEALEGEVKMIAGAGFSLALFLIGSGLSVAALRSVGWRVLVQATVLWVILAAVSLLIIVSGR